MDQLSIAALAGGLLGAMLRALMAPDQVTFSKKSIVDVILGGLVGVLMPAFGLLPQGLAILPSFAVVAVTSYASSNLVQDIVARTAAKKP